MVSLGFEQFSLLMEEVMACRKCITFLHPQEIINSAELHVLMLKLFAYLFPRNSYAKESLYYFRETSLECIYCISSFTTYSHHLSLYFHYWNKCMTQKG